MPGVIKKTSFGVRSRDGRGLTSRTQERIDNNLGIVPGERMGNYSLVRSKTLELYDKYMKNEQYDHLMPWQSGDKDTYIPIRRRKPRVIYGLPKRLVDTVSGKLLGESVFPAFKVEDDEDTTFVLQLLIKLSSFRLHTLYAVRKAIGAGSSFIRFYVTGPRIFMEVYDSKYCYPKFDDEQELEEVEIRYVYDDHEDKDERGAPKKKWYRLLLGRDEEVLFDNPEYKPGGAAPYFEEVARADHGLGFVQGQWFKTSENKDSPDGESLLAYCTDLVDSINYSLSQGDQAISYAQEPQLAIKGMDVSEIDELIKSSEKAWNLGRDGEAQFVEANLGGVEKAMEVREEHKQKISDVCRVVMLDPEKIVGSAQSAKAMQVLHGPLVDLVQELRTAMEEPLIALLAKLLAVVVILQQRGQNEVLTMPAGWVPESLNITASWPEIFPMTMEDLQKKVQVALSAANASILSRETATAWVAKDFGVENIEEEVAKIKAQPVLNPFGAF